MVLVGYPVLVSETSLAFLLLPLASVLPAMTSSLENGRDPDDACQLMSSAAL